MKKVLTDRVVVSSLKYTYGYIIILSANMYSKNL